MMKTPPSLLALALAGIIAAPLALRADDPKPAPPAGERPDRGPRGGRMDPAERLKNLKEKLGLSDEQTEKVKAIFEKHRGEFAKLREDQSMKPEEKRPKMQELRKAEMEEVKGVLTPEQQEKLKDLRPPGGPGGQRGDRQPEAK